ncbi:MAG: DUF3303 domain-containing protein [Candidatus Krumholzibacteria bacterium]|nr:DUF3303 domain-containing protein [Candidatus Krumholzibacteria bacterium]
MKFMVTWQLHPEKLHETLGLFSNMSQKDDEAAMGDDVKLLGRWHDLARGCGVAIFETNNAEAFSKYALNWNGAMDLDVSMVLDDEEARAIGREL